MTAYLTVQQTEIIVTSLKRGYFLIAGSKFHFKCSSEIMLRYILYEKRQNVPTGKHLRTYKVDYIN